MCGYLDKTCGSAKVIGACRNARPDRHFRRRVTDSLLEKKGSESCRCRQGEGKASKNLPRLPYSSKRRRHSGDFSSWLIVSEQGWMGHAALQGVFSPRGRFFLRRPGPALPREKKMGWPGPYPYLIRRGGMPCQMENKWLIYATETQLEFVRSWNGVCICQVQIKETPDGIPLGDALVNRDREQYGCSDDRHDYQMIHNLVSDLLLGVDAPLPY